MPELNNEDKMQIRRIVSEQLGVELKEVEDLQEDENLLIKLQGDSLDQVELVMAVEDEFLLNFGHPMDDAVNDAKSLGDLYKLVAKYRRTPV